MPLPGSSGGVPLVLIFEIEAKREDCPTLDVCQGGKIGKETDDGNDNEKFDECECLFFTDWQCIAPSFKEKLVFQTVAISPLAVFCRYCYSSGTG
jgi:hypothetical protein